MISCIDILYAKYQIFSSISCDFTLICINDKYN